MISYVIITRYIKKYIKKDLTEKIVLVGGPRQVGKTTLARQFITKKEQYLNWDDLEDRELIRKHRINPELGVVVLDEVHKYARWRTLIKGLYDKCYPKLKIIVTGSAKLDYFRKGGDSLFGRCYYYRLHPFTVSEVKSLGNDNSISDLLKYGGFPEPYLKKSLRFHRRWLRERLYRVVYLDLNDLSLVQELSKIELLIDLLPSKVGSGFSLRNIQEDLEVSPNTVKRWLELLEKLYYCYRVLPWGSKKVRAVKKTPKLYLWDWSELEEGGAKVENFVASHLLKYCHFLEDTEGWKMDLRYLKDVDGREIDFVVFKNKKPLFAVEVKSEAKDISRSILYFRERINIPKFYQVHLRGNTEYLDKNIYVLNFRKFCQLENLP